MDQGLESGIFDHYASLNGDDQMGLSADQKANISKLLSRVIEKKLKSYVRETSSLPFLVRLLQDSDKVAAYSFIHSVATSLGMSVYEQVSEYIGSENSDECYRSYDVGGVLSKNQKSVVSHIVASIRNRERRTNYDTEMAEVLNADPAGGRDEKDGRLADLYLRRGEVEYYFEIKTAKPNIDVFEKSKEKLLQWIARRRKPIRAILAIPYNPYHPEPYARFTQEGMLTPGKDLLVADAYWDFLGGEGTYSDLLGVFDKTGKRFKDQIAERIAEVARSKMNF